MEFGRDVAIHMPTELWKKNIMDKNISHTTIHVWYIYLHLVVLNGKIW